MDKLFAVYLVGSAGSFVFEIRSRDVRSAGMAAGKAYPGKAVWKIVQL